MKFRDAKNAFEDAIRTGRLTDNQHAGTVNYAGNYMYMGTNENGIDLFKHKMTRQYLPFEITGAN